MYLGQGMCQIWDAGKSSLVVDGKPINIANLATIRKRDASPRVFYIPAQRVLSLANGWPRPFQSFSPEDPFSLRDFSETFRLLLEQEFTTEFHLFPRPNRLKREYRDLLTQHLFAGFELYVDRFGAMRRLVLRRKTEGTGIPFLAWSAGQREFVPLLMGLYWLMPPGKISRREKLTWVIIEEPEMGLHPNAVSVVLLLLLELLRRQYRVCISTHSPHVLEVVWAIRIMQAHNATAEDLLELFSVRKSEPMSRVASTALKKELRVFYFKRNGDTVDITNLDPGAQSKEEAGWGGLTEFSAHVNDLVARVVQQ
ncbi:MAG: AAA family ATPase [Thermogutta sp.]